MWLIAITDCYCYGLQASVDGDFGTEAVSCQTAKYT